MRWPSLEAGGRQPVGRIFTCRGLFYPLPFQISPTAEKCAEITPVIFENAASHFYDDRQQFLQRSDRQTAAPLCTLDRATGVNIDKTPFIKGGYLTRWNFANKSCFVHGPERSGFLSGIYEFLPVGLAYRRHRKPLPDCEETSRNEYWQPSGRYMVVAVEKQDWKDTRMFGNPITARYLDLAFTDDLWLVTADGGRAWQLTNEPANKTQGELMPVLSGERQTSRVVVASAR